MRTGIVYGLVCPIKNRVVYVGQTTKKLEYRLSAHKSPYNVTNSIYGKWIESLRKRNKINKLTAVILEYNVPKSDLSRLEKYHIIQCYISGKCVNSMWLPKGGSKKYLIPHMMDYANRLKPTTDIGVTIQLVKP